MSNAVTRGIRVEVESSFVEERSAPDEDYYFFSYHVKISNEGLETAQLLTREWVITDADGNQERVKGPGVVGDQPVLTPGDSYEYTSFCPLRTNMGAMQGNYTFETESGERFEAEIAAFTLAVPHVVN